MSLKKSARQAAKQKLLADLRTKELNGIYEELGPIYSIGGQFTFNLTRHPDVIKQEEPPTLADKLYQQP